MSFMHGIFSSKYTTISSCALVRARIRGSAFLSLWKKEIVVKKFNHIITVLGCYIAVIT